MPKAISRLLHSKNPKIHIVGTISRTYAEFEEGTAAADNYWHEGQPLYTITDTQLRNIARELAGDDRKLYTKIYTTMHEGLRA